MVIYGWIYQKEYGNILKIKQVDRHNGDENETGRSITGKSGS